MNLQPEMILGDFEGAHDILKTLAESYDFTYPKDKASDVLAKEVKVIVDDKAKYTDWSMRNDIKAGLKVGKDFRLRRKLEDLWIATRYTVRFLSNKLQSTVIPSRTDIGLLEKWNLRPLELAVIRLFPVYFCET